MREKMRMRHKNRNEFFEDFSLDSMTGSDDGNYQAQTVDISEDSKTNAFEQTEIVESMSEILSQESPKNKDNTEDKTQEAKTTTKEGENKDNNSTKSDQQ